MPKVTILTDNPDSWIMDYIEDLIELIQKKGFDLEHIFKVNEIKKGDVLFALSCEQIIKKDLLALNKYNMVAHPSNLPIGRGWSPIAWDILKGSEKIFVSLLNINEKIDAGDIYKKECIYLNGTELNNEIKELQYNLTKDLILSFLDDFPNIKLHPQNEKDATYYKKRTIKDAYLDTNKTIKEQFNLLRISDNKRYPARFKIEGKDYILKIYKD